MRCPDYLNVDDFDKLAASISTKLSDASVSALGEIAELLALKILEESKRNSSTEQIEIETLLASARKIGISFYYHYERKKVISVDLEGTRVPIGGAQGV
jgi:hypothetical protein